MRRESLFESIVRVCTEQFSRSSGPGGQNVNKVNTRVTLRIPVSELDLSEDESLRVHELLANRINLHDELVIHSSETRSREKNRGLALSRAVELIDTARRPVLRRRATRPSRAARERRLQQKRLTSRRKRDRRRPGEE